MLVNLKCIAATFASSLFIARIELSVVSLSATRRAEFIAPNIHCVVLALAVCADKRLFIIGEFVQSRVLGSRQQLQIFEPVVGFVEIDVMNFVACRNFAVEIRPHCTMQRHLAVKMPALRSLERKPETFLRFVVDNFNRRTLRFQNQLMRSGNVSHEPLVFVAMQSAVFGKRHNLKI